MSTACLSTRTTSRTYESTDRRETALSRLLNAALDEAKCSPHSRVAFRFAIFRHGMHGHRGRAAGRAKSATRAVVDHWHTPTWTSVCYCSRITVAHDVKGIRCFAIISPQAVLKAMQASHFRSGIHSGMESSTAESNEGSDVLIRVWSCPGELGVPVDDAAGVQPVSPSSPKWWNAALLYVTQILHCAQHRESICCAVYCVARMTSRDEASHVSSPTVSMGPREL